MAKNLFLWLASLLVLIAILANTDKASASSLSKREASDELPEYEDDQAGDDEDAQNDDGDGDTDDSDDDLENYPDPLITSISKNLRVKSGQTVWLPCEIDHLSSSIVVSWKRGDDRVIFLGNNKLSNDPRYVLQENKTLSISQANEADSGIYTCAIIGGNEVHHQLEVFSPQPPKIIRMTPQTKYIQSGSSLEISCEATGNPKPKISWRKELKGTSEILTSSDVEFRANSVYIAVVKRHHQGKYVCLADNNVGSPALGYLPIVVVGEPRVHVHKSLINGDLGGEAIMVCQAHEEPPSTIKWLKDNIEIESSEDVNVKTEGQKSTLTVFSIKEEDFGIYTCQAMNQYGNHSRSVKLIKEPVLEDIKGEGSSISLNIHSHAPMKFTEIQYRRIDDNKDNTWKVREVEPKLVDKHRYVLQYTLDNLEPGKYEARVRASNTYGFSPSPNAVYFEGDYTKEDNQQIRQAGVFGSSASHNNVEKLALLFSSIFCMAVIRCFAY